MIYFIIYLVVGVIITSISYVYAAWHWGRTVVGAKGFKDGWDNLKFRNFWITMFFYPILFPVLFYERFIRGKFL